MAHRAQQLLEHSLLSELRAIVARALSGLDMFAGGQLSELDLLGSDFLETPAPMPEVLTLFKLARVKRSFVGCQIGCLGLTQQSCQLPSVY